jgi:hypothetical protein
LVKNKSNDGIFLQKFGTLHCEEIARPTNKLEDYILVNSPPFVKVK